MTEQLPDALQMYLRAFLDFISNPTQQNLSILRKVRKDPKVGDKGYCHPYAEYVDDNGVGCATGEPMGRYEGKQATSPCPFLRRDEDGGLKCSIDIPESMPAVHLRAVESLSILQERHPNWEGWKKG